MRKRSLKQMIQRFLILICVMCTAVSLTTCQKDPFQHIRTIHSFDEVHFNEITTDALVIFDVDETLIQPTDAFLINEHTLQGEAFRQALLAKHPNIKNWDFLISVMLKEAQRPLIEPIIVQKIKELQKRHIPVIACTGMNVGPKGSYASLEDWRYTHLKSLGFEGSFNQLEFRLKGFKKNPGFYKGLLSTDLEWKGPVIGAFLDEMKLAPKIVIMFDDTLEELKSTQQECEKRGIVFQGYLYKGAKSKPWNQQLAQIQADYLITHQHWLSDEQAFKLQKTN